ncbi:hypothetical protein C8J27_101795 [Rhodobacter aestuarii]|uniref:PsiF repeat-containing protein n=1 Tax=Rhodobacter aestuarii TaxID=453582 RepID=A0A1N7P994_9RHOB|nr:MULTISPECIES: hypothetical protein [Rhodobacter]PTV97678.1 hypothetical protein C8J27_101795 [Rhodobacter aestuarii]SIT07172.1 hypothetical protein SAMN05421580_109155 [Rhodobacter aestuarii]SOC04704.1 hypothetical protein SAMN05877809_103270 [Rhodobacter sp. JA431]
MKHFAMALAALAALAFVAGPVSAGDQTRARDKSQIDSPTKDQKRDKTGDCISG